MSPRRQTIPVDEVRAPPFVDDQMSPAEVRQEVNQQTSLQDLINIVASQLRILSGSTGWLEAPPPGATSGFTGQLVVGEKLDGAYDGTGQTFMTARPYLPGSLTLSFNGMALTYGTTADYVTHEAGGPGTGYNAVKLTGMPPPRARDVLLVSYVRTV